MTDARLYFDSYTVQYSSLHEIVEVLQHTYLFSTRCLAHVLREMAKAKVSA